MKRKDNAVAGIDEIGKFARNRFQPDLVRSFFKPEQRSVSGTVGRSSYFPVTAVRELNDIFVKVFSLRAFFTRINGYFSRSENTRGKVLSVTYRDLVKAAFGNIVDSVFDPLTDRFPALAADNVKFYVR